jgi:cell division protein FtsQ
MFIRKRKFIKKKRECAVKKKKRNLKGLFYGVLSVSVLFVIVAGGFGFYKYLLTLRYFHIKEITVKGGNKVSANEIIGRSGLGDGKNLFLTDVNDIVKRVEGHPWIKKAEVRRIFPSEIEIAVKERIAASLIKFDDIYYIDKDGVVFQRVASEEEINLPIITGVDMEELLEEDSSASEGIFKALRLLEITEENNFQHLGEISEIKIDNMNGLTLYTMDGAVRIDIGSKDFKNRLLRFENIVSNMKHGLTGVDFIDLDYEKKGVVRYNKSLRFSQI